MLKMIFLIMNKIYINVKMDLSTHTYINYSGGAIGSDYFWKWWRKASENVGLEGVSLYPGTKHTTATGLGALYSPEDVQDHATGHASDAFRRYFRPHEGKFDVVTLDIDRLRKGDPSVIHYSDHKKQKTH